MSDLAVTIAALVVSAFLGACVGFVAARLFPTKAARHERTAERPAPASAPSAPAPPSPVPTIVRLPSTVSAVPPTPAPAASHVVEAELTDAEIDALPADLPFLARARPRIASPPRARALNRL